MLNGNVWIYSANFDKLNLFTLLIIPVFCLEIFLNDEQIFKA